jgi:hypothetical protein
LLTKKSRVGETRVEKSRVGKTRVEKSRVDKTRVEKSRVPKNVRFEMKKDVFRTELTY